MSVDRTDPAAVFLAAADALNREDWLGAAALCDPASLASFRRAMLQQIAPGPSWQAVTVDGLLRHAPDMPREAAEYQVAQAARYADPSYQLRSQFPGVASVEALHALSPVALFARWLHGRSWRGQLARHVAEHPGHETAVRALEGEPPPQLLFRVIGALPDGDRVVHVLYTIGAPGPDEGVAAWLAELPDDDARALARDLNGRQHPHVALCRRQADGTWALVADHDFVGLGSIGFAIDVAEEEGDASGG